MSLMSLRQFGIHSVSVLFVAISTLTGFAADPPLVESYLVEGKMADGYAALAARLQKEPNDDQARFGLGVVQFLQGFENLGSSLCCYGLRTERAARGFTRVLSGTIPQNPNPEPISYADMRAFLRKFVDDLNAAEATLAAIKDPNVKLPLHVGLVKFDPIGQGKPISAKIVLGQNQPDIPPQMIDSFVVGFDRGDVSSASCLVRPLILASSSRAISSSFPCCLFEIRVPSVPIRG